MPTNDPAYKSLRKKAEKIANGEENGLPEEEQLDLLRLAHELEMAHVDLEVQNEQLRHVGRELEAARNEFYDLYESAPVAFLSLSPKGLITRANSAARNMLYPAVGHHTGIVFSQVVMPRDWRVFFASMKKIAERGKPGSFELRLRGKEGRVRHVHLQAAAKYDAQRAFTHWDLAIFDITEQKRLEKELRDSRKQLFLATSAGGIGIFIQEMKTRKAYWNDQLYRLLGLTPQTGTEEGETFFQLIHPEDRKGVLQNTASLFELGRTIDLDFRIIRADGHIRWLAAKGTLHRDDARRPLLIQGTAFDITEKKRSEIELQENRERFRSVLEHSLDIAFRRNLQTQRYDYISPVIEEVTGFSKSEIGEMGSDELMALVHPEDRTRAASEMEKAYRSGMGKLEFRFQTRDGRYVWMSDHFSIQYDDEGRPLYRIGVMRDITDQKQTEKELAEQRRALSVKVDELEQSNRELSEYAYAVSHDLKAPLRAVRNYADFLIEDLEDQLSGEQKIYLEGIKTALSQGDALIRDLLNFSRIGQVMEAPEEVDLEEAVGEVCEMLTLPEEAKVSVHSGCPPLITTRSLLMQILINLIGNGIKFNDSDVKRVEVWCRPVPIDRVELLVKDNGIGIGERYKQRVFRVFQRLHTPKEYEGTGIGLAIVRKAAANLGGSVRLESTPGQGSTFIVDLPREPPE